MTPDDDVRLNMGFVGIPSFCRWPVCENLDELDADIAVLGVPYDAGGSYRPGMRFAPRRIREMSLRLVPRGTKPKGYFEIDTGRTYLEEEARGNRMWDCGDVDILYTLHQETLTRVTEAVAKIKARGAFPVVFGGDDSISFPAVRALKEAPIDIVSIDAHLDYTDNLSGVTHAGTNPLRRMSELPNVKKITHIGIRGVRASKLSYEATLKRGNVVVTADSVRRKGARSALKEALPLSHTFMHIDIDGLDPSVAPGCNGNEPCGLSYAEAKEVISTVIDNAESVIGLCVTEVNPMIDIGDMTSGIAAQLTLEFLGMAAASPKWAHRNKPR